MHKPAPRLSVAVLLLAVSSCATTGPVYHTDGPVEAEGVTITLAGQRCDFDDTNEPETAAQGGFLDLGLVLQVKNGTAQPITLDPTAIRLVAGTNTEPPSTAGPSKTVAPGAVETVTVRFESRGPWSCQKPMTLTLARVVQVGARPIELGRVSFVAKG